jgi:hypothetical protein
METRDEGIYTLDVSVKGHEIMLVDGDPRHGEVTLFGRLNEDIHVERKNTVFDIAGIVYTESEVEEGAELLTTYGGMYKWGHVIQEGYDRLVKHISIHCPDIEVGLPGDIKDLRYSNPLHAWVKALIYGQTEDLGHHSTVDEDTPINSPKGFISYITSNIAQYKYAFRKCGLPDKTWEKKTKDDLGRKFPEHAKNAKDDLLAMSFSELIKINQRVSVLWSSVCNAKIVKYRSGGTTTRVASNQCENTVQMMMDLGLGETSTGANEDNIVGDICKEFPWMTPILKNLRITGLTSNQDPISSAIVDILENRLDTAELHSSMSSRDWVMGDGLAAYLRSGMVYCKYNKKDSIRIRSAEDVVEKKYQDITRWSN